MNEFDVAAEKARAELPASLAEISAEELASWFKRWYRTAGHKRLGRLVVKLAA